MSDFETRVRESLDLAAAGAPAPHDLVGAARARARTRRRTTFAVAAAVALTTIAVPTVMSLGPSTAPGPGPGEPDSSAVPTHAPGVPSGWRIESWRDVAVRVPTTWGYGTLSTWCLEGGEPGTPVVERPGGVVPSILCQGPRAGYGVRFLDPAVDPPDLTSAPGTVQELVAGRQYPVGAWAGYTMGVNAGVLVVAPTEHVARYLLDSFRPLRGPDGNGCAPQDTGTTPAHPSGRMAVCRYAADGWLEQSELLSPEDGETAMDALAAAPVRQEQGPCSATPDRYSTVVFGTGSDLGSVQVVWESECPEARGVFFSGVVRELTEDVMYWALSPGWSGGVDGDVVPLPPELR